MEERRKFVRLNVSVTVQYTIKERQPLEKESLTKNISGGGICLFVEEKLSPGTYLDLKIYLPDGSTPIPAIGRVVWTQEFVVAKGLKFEVGIEFIQIKEEDRERIKKYVFGSLKSPIS